MTRLSFFPIALAIGLVAAAPVTGKPAVEGFRVVWIVEPAPPPTAELSIAPDGLILKQRLLPMGLVELTEEHRIGKTGNKAGEVLPAGTELILATGASKPVYCALRIKGPNVLSMLLTPYPSGSQRCFMDDNADGKFDRSFAATSSVKSVPHPSGIVPRDAAPTVSAAYRPKDVSAFTASYFVGVQYSGQAKIGTLRRFYTVYGNDGDWGRFTADNIFTKRDRDLPKTLEVLGSSFTVLGGEGKNVRVKVDRAIPAQPFGVFVSVVRY